MHKGINTTVDEGQTPVVVNALTATGVGTCGADDNQAQAGHLVPTASEPYTLAIRGREGGAVLEHRQDGTSNTILTPSGGRGGIGVGAVAIQERAVSENPDAGPDGKGWRDDGAAYTLEARTVPQAVAWSIMPQNSGRDYKARAVDVAQPLMAGRTGAGGNQGGDIIQTVGTLATNTGPNGNDAGNFACNQGVDAGHIIATAMRVRRLTPVECERLQGFPDGWTQVPYRNKPAADGPRYKAIGNSMAVPVMAWIGQRIAEVNSIISLKEAA